MLHIFCFLLFLNNRDFNIVVTMTCFFFSVISTFSSWSSSYFVWRLIRTDLLAPINNSDQHWSLGESRDAKTQTGCPRVSWPGMAARKPARVTLVFRSLTTLADVSKRSQQLKLKKKTSKSRRSERFVTRRQIRSVFHSDMFQFLPGWTSPERGVRVNVTFSLVSLQVVVSEPRRSERKNSRLSSDTTEINSNMTHQNTGSDLTANAFTGLRERGADWTPDGDTEISQGRKTPPLTLGFIHQPQNYDADIITFILGHRKLKQLKPVVLTPASDQHTAQTPVDPWTMLLYGN